MPEPASSRPATQSTLQCSRTDIELGQVDRLLAGAAHNYSLALTCMHRGMGLGHVHVFFCPWFQGSDLSFCQWSDNFCR